LKKRCQRKGDDVLAHELVFRGSSDARTKERGKRWQNNPYKKNTIAKKPEREGRRFKSGVERGKRRAECKPTHAYTRGLDTDGLILRYHGPQNGKKFREEKKE